LSTNNWIYFISKITIIGIKIFGLFLIEGKERKHSLKAFNELGGENTGDIFLDTVFVPNPKVLFIVSLKNVKE